MSTLFVYRNLHKKCYSLRDTKTRKVVAYKDSVILKTAVFKVSEKGRQKVLDTKQKNIHAGIQGTPLKKKPNNLSEKYVRHIVKYDPYKYDSFVYLIDESPIETADYVELTPHAVYAYTRRY